MNETIYVSTSKSPTVGNAVKALEYIAIYLLALPLSPKIHFGPLHALYKIQSSPCQQALIRFHSEATNLQSISVLNEVGPRIDTQTQAKTVKKHCSKYYISNNGEGNVYEEMPKRSMKQDMLLRARILNEQ
jgi:hypothetical protein